MKTAEDRVRAEIGVYGCSIADPRETIRSLEACTRGDFEIVRLDERPGAPATWTGARRIHTEAPREGRASCFNRLAGRSDADLIVLLEAGAIVTPGWLDYLVEALCADPRNGLAGPSTNRCWNEQAAFKDAAGSPQDIADTAGRAAAEYAGVVRTLEPLHSLADFCYVVRRAVVDAIGAADETYDPGPCWEMDYNIRAARAGFCGVWACAAYVHRAPLHPASRRTEGLLHEASKRLYQAKFCGRRLRGEAFPYKAHCRGDACEHFAPPALIEIRRPAPAREQCRGDATAARVVTASGDDLPLVSCVMATRDRVDFALQSIGYFRRQDYPARELIILDDGTDGLAARLPEDPRIRHVRLSSPTSIGAKRNHGCELARGRIIAQWDDDDWYAPGRLSAQVAPLVARHADVTGLMTGVVLDLPRWAFWRCTPELHRRLFVADVHGGTLVYERRLWERLGRYPDSSIAEDAAFLRQVLRRGARLVRVPGEDVFVYVRHAGNTWSFECGRHVDPGGWQRVAETPLLASDRAFYTARMAAGPGADRGLDEPLVTCIMPTADRRAFAGRAVEYFLGQTYANRELVVVDDGDAPVDDLMPTDPRIRYVRLERRMPLGAKRNLAVAHGHGTIVAHWDDDDWYRADYLSEMIGRLRAVGDEGAVVGLKSYLVYLVHDAALKRCRAGGVAGATLCYFRSLWDAHRFQDVDCAEDYFFLRDSRARVVGLDLPEIFSVIRHGSNTWVEERGVNVNARLRRLPNHSATWAEVAGPEACRFYASLASA